MPNDIENRVVKMSFDNKSFEQNASESMKTLAKLKESLKFDGIADEIEKSFDSFEKIIKGSSDGVSSFPDKLVEGFNGLKNSISAAKDAATEMQNNIGANIEAIAKKFKSLTSVVGKVADKIKDDIANKIKNTLKDMTVGQFNAGMTKYEKETRAVQTITNATGKTAAEVDEVLKTLMKYTDETSYDFAEMVSSIGKFTSVGVDLNLAEKAMEGIANEAAKSGAGVQEANRAMYNFAQALSAGYVKLIDWKSIENANMATKEFKEQLIETAIELGTLEKKGDKIGSVVSTNEKSLEAGQAALKKANKATKDRAEKVAAAQKKIADATKKVEVNYKTFNETLSSKWLTSDVLVKTLEKYSDTSTEFGLAAFHAAQEALTFKDVLDATKDAISSGWMQTFQYLFGNLDEARSLWTKVANSIYDFVAIFSEARNNLLGSWHELGGYNIAVEAASNIWHSFMDVLYAVKDAWRNVFPPLTAERLVSWTAKVRDLTAEFRSLVGIQESLREDSEEETDDIKGNKTYYVEYSKDLNKAWKMTKELKKGDVGEEVKILQNELKNANFLPKDFIADGIYNEKTEEAVKMLQKNVGTKVTGAWDAATRSATWASKEFVEIHKYRQKITEDWIAEGKKVIAVYNKEINIAKKLNNTINKNSRVSDIKSLQEALIKAGYLTDKTNADGIYGPETELAVRKLQGALNVEVTGAWNEVTKAAAESKKVFIETKEVEETVDPTKYAKDAAKAYSDLTDEQEKALETNKQLSKALSKTGTHLETDNWFAKGKDVKKYTNREGKTVYSYNLDSNVDINSLKNLQKASIKTESDLVRLDQKAKEIKDTTVRVQNALVHYGYLADSSLANGIYGPETKVAIEKLQKDLGIEVTGAWDTATQVAVRDSDKFNKEITKTDWKETLLTRVQEFVKGFASVISTVKKIIFGVVRFVAGLGVMLKPLIDPIARLVTFISKMFQNLNKGVTNNKVYGFIDNILILLKPVADVIRWIGNAINGFLDGYRKYIAGLEGGIVRVGKNGKKAVNSGLITFKTFFDYIAASIKNSPIFKFILGIVDAARKGVTIVIAIVAKLILTVFEKIAALKKIFDEVISIDGFKNKIQYIFNSISEYITNTKEAIANSNIWEYFTNIPAVKSIIGFFDNIRERVQLFIEKWNKIGESDGIQGRLTYVFNLIKSYIGKFISYLSETQFGKYISETFDNVKSVVSSKLSILGEEITTRMTELFERFKNSSFGKVLIDIYTILSGVISSLINKFNEVFPNFKSSIITTWNSIISVISDGSISISERITSVVEIIKSLVVSAFEAILSKWEQLKQAYPIINTITSIITKGLSGIGGFLSGTISSIASFFKGSSITKIGSYASEGIAKGMTKGASKVSEAAISVAESAVEALTGPKGLDEHSPSKVTERAGEYASEGAAKGMLNSKGKVETAAEDVANSVEKPFAETSNNISKDLTFSSILDKITSEVQKFIASIKEMGLEGVINIALKALSVFAALKAASGIKKFGKGFLEAGKSVKNVGEGLTKNLNTLTEASKNFLLGKEGKNDIAQIIKEYGEAQNKAAEESNKDSIGTTLLKIAGSLAIVAAAIFAISKIDTKDLIKGGIALGAIASAIILCAFALSKINAENIEKLGNGLMSLSKGIGLIVVSILGMNVIVANTSGSTLLKSIGIITGLILGMALLEALLTKIGSKSKAGIVDVKVSGIASMCGGVALLVVSIGSMARKIKKYGTGDVMLALDNIRSLLTRLGIIEVILAFLGRGSKAGIISVKISGMLNMCLGIYILSMAVEKMAKGIKKNTYYDEAFDMVGSLLFKLGAIEVILALINLGNKGTKVKIGGILGMAAGIYLISMAIGKIAKDYEKYKTYEEAFDLLSSMLWTLSITSLIFAGTLAALSAIGVGGALSAVGALVVFFGVSGIFALLVGAINNWTNGGLLNILVEGAKTIGAGISAFINAFTSGVNEGKEESPSLIEKLKSFATGLSDVMDDLKPFFEKCESITRKQSMGVGYLISAILKMTGTNMVDAVSSWVGDKLTGESSGSGFVDFASNLVTFADYIIEFADKIAGTEVDGVKTGGLNTQAIEDSVPAIRAMDALAQACAGIAWGELKTKVFEVIAGDNSIVTFAEKMVTAAPKIKAYGEAVKDLKVKKIENSASVLEALGRAANAIPGADGVIQKVFGEHNIEDFGNKLGALGTGLSDFVTNTKDIPDNYDATPFIDALTGFANIAKEIPAASGWIQQAFGEKSLDTFGGQLGGLGTGLKNFVDNTQGISGDDEYDSTYLISILNGLAEIQDKIYASGGTVSKFFGGEKDLGVFGEQIVVLANKLTEFETITDDITVSKFDVIGTALSALADAVLAVPSIGNASDLINTTEGIVSMLTGESYLEAGKTIIDRIIEGIEVIGNADKIKESINTVLSEAIKKVNATYSDMKTSPAIKPGEYVDDGLAKGIENNAGKVSAAILKVVNDALAAAKGPKGLDEHSPSKVTEEMGEYAGEGFAKGLNNSETIVVEAAEDITDAFTDNIELPSATEVKDSTEEYVEAYADGISSGAESIKDANKELDKELDKTQSNISKTNIASGNYNGSFTYTASSSSGTQVQYKDHNTRIVPRGNVFDKYEQSKQDTANATSTKSKKKDNTISADLDVGNTNIEDTLSDELENTSIEMPKIEVPDLSGDDGLFSGLLEHLGDGITNLFSGDNPDNPLNGLTSLFDGNNPDNPFSGIIDFFGGLLGDGEDSIWNKIAGIIDPNNPNNPFSGVLETLGGYLTGEGGIVEKVMGIFSPDNENNPLKSIYDTISGYLNPDNPNGLIKEGKRLIGKLLGIDDGEESAEEAVDKVEKKLAKELDSDNPGSTMAGVKEVAGKSMTDALSAQDDKKVAANMTKTVKALNNSINTEVDKSPVITPVVDYSQINGSASEIRNLIGIDDVATSINAQNSGALATSVAVGQVGNTLSDMKTLMDTNHKLMNGYLEYMSLRLDTIDEDLGKLKIYLDSDALVAGTVDKMDKALGKKRSGYTKVGSR